MNLKVIQSILKSQLSFYILNVTTYVLDFLLVCSPVCVLQVFAIDKERVLCSRIRMLILTEIVRIGKDSMSTIANCFAKHSEKVCKRFYVQYFSEKAASRIFWECCQRYKPQEDLKKASRVRSVALENKAIPSIVKLYRKKVDTKDRLNTNVTVEDKNLMKALSKLGKEQGIAKTFTYRKTQRNISKCSENCFTFLMILKIVFS